MGYAGNVSYSAALPEGRSAAKESSPSPGHYYPSIEEVKGAEIEMDGGRRQMVSMKSSYKMTQITIGYSGEQGEPSAKAR